MGISDAKRKRSKEIDIPLTKQGIERKIGRTIINFIEKNNFMKNLFLISAILLIMACFPLPYGYYTFLRIAITIVSVICIVQNIHEGFATQNIIWAIIAILFNPIIPIYFSKTIWVVLDLAIAGWFGVKWYKEKSM